MGAEVTFAAATEHLARELAADMCAEDVAEVLAGGQPTPLASLLFSLSVSELAVAMMINSKVAAIFGVQPLPPEGGEAAYLGPLRRGIGWVLTSNVSRRHPRAYMHHSRVVVKALLDYCPDLTNLMDARHKPALRWAKWMGFEMGEPMPYGPAGLSFIPFRVRA